MNKLTTPVLLACLCAAGTASAQSYSSYPDNRYEQDQYDYARVIRVDPIIDSGRYGSRTVSTSQRCYYRDADDDYVYGSDGYYDQDNDGDRYGNDRYRRDDDYRDERYGSDGGRTMATVIGGIAGAVLGSKVGDGSGRYVGTAVGSMIGGMAGRSIYDSQQQRNRQVQRGSVRVCDPVPANDRYGGGYDDGRVSGYDVTYEYAGRTYHTRTDYHPGDRIRVRVDVRAE